MQMTKPFTLFQLNFDTKNVIGKPQIAFDLTGVIKANYSHVKNIVFNMRWLASNVILQALFIFILVFIFFFAFFSVSAGLSFPLVKLFT